MAPCMWDLVTRSLLYRTKCTKHRCIYTQVRTGKSSVLDQLASTEVSYTSTMNQRKVKSTWLFEFKYFYFSRFFLIAAIAAAASGQADDFRCPDEFLGFYPHLYRYEQGGRVQERKI